MALCLTALSTKPWQPLPPAPPTSNPLLLGQSHPPIHHGPVTAAPGHNKGAIFPWHAAPSSAWSFPRPPSPFPLSRSLAARSCHHDRRHPCPSLSLCFRSGPYLAATKDLLDASLHLVFWLMPKRERNCVKGLAGVSGTVTQHPVEGEPLSPFSR